MTVYCQTHIPNAVGSCTRRALPSQQHCRQHAQAAYVRAWREAHPQEVYGATWECPLCGRAIQIYQVGMDPHLADGGLSFLAHRHQASHGQSWTAFAALAAEPVAAGPAAGEG